MSTDITPYRTASLDEKRAYVQTLAAAGELLPKGLWANAWNEQKGQMVNAPSPGKILLVVETGIMLGLHPMAALRGIDVIEGNPTIKPALMSALIRDAGHSLRIRQTGTVEGGDLAVTTTIVRSDDPDYPYDYTWTPHDALRAGLLDSYQPDANGIWRARARSSNGGVKPWEAYTARMCRWRSLGDAASAAAEDVLMGMHLTPEELRSSPRRLTPSPRNAPKRTSPPSNSAASSTPRKRSSTPPRNYRRRSPHGCTGCRTSTGCRRRSTTPAVSGVDDDSSLLPFLGILRVPEGVPGSSKGTRTLGIPLEDCYADRQDKNKSR